MSDGRTQLPDNVARILKPDGSTAGSGFFPTRDQLVTCAHVIELARSGDRVEFVFAGDPAVRSARVVETAMRPSNQEDIAALALAEPVDAERVLPLAAWDEGHRTNLMTFGYPASTPVEGMWGRCNVRGRLTYEGFDALQFSADEVEPGFSGAPLFDERRGVVVGLVLSIVDSPKDKYGRQQFVGFARPSELLWALTPALAFDTGPAYQALAAFGVEQAVDYFGREAVTAELLQRLSADDVVTIVGVSGSGKSSLVQAGLERGLRETPVLGLAHRQRCLLRPGPSPLLDLLLALAALPETSTAEAFGLAPGAFDTAESRRVAADALAERDPAALAERLRAIAAGPGLIVIVDQLERLWTEGVNPRQRDLLIATLLAAAGDHVKVLLVLRADFYGLALESSLAPHLGRALVVPQMTDAELYEAIVAPARRRRRAFEPGLVEQIVRDVGGRAGELPLLQFALTELWERDASTGLLTRASYDALGFKEADGSVIPGAQGAIARRAEHVLASLTPDERAAVPGLFLKLVRISSVEAADRASVLASRRAMRAEWDETTQRVAERLAGERLLTWGHDPVTEQPTVEVAHEALVRAWPTLRRWVRESDAFVRWFDRELTPELHRWIERCRDPAFLLPYPMIDAASGWLESMPGELAGAPAEYIRESVDARAAALRRKAVATQRRAFGFAALAILLVVAGAAVVVARRSSQQAQLQRRVTTALEIAAEAQRQAERGQSERGALLARQAFLLNEQLGGALAEQIDAPLRAAMLGRYFTRVIPVDRGARDYTLITAVDLSRDGRWLVVADSDRRVRVHDLARRTAAPVDYVGPQIAGPVAFIPGSRRLAIPTADRRLIAWVPGQARQPARTLGSLAGPVTAIAVSAAGRVAVGDRRGRIRVFDPDGSPPIALEMSSAIWSLALSPNGRLLAVGSDSKHLHVWSLDIARPRMREYRWHAAPIGAVAFSADGRRLATGSQDTYAAVWNVSHRGKLALTRTLHADQYSVDSVAFSPDGRTLVTGSMEAVRVWRLEKRSSRPEEFGFSTGSPVQHVTFAADGARFVTADEKDLRVWDMRPLGPVSCALHGSEGQVHQVAFDGDARALSVGSDRFLRLWQLTPVCKPIQAVPAGEDVVFSVALAPDRRTAVTASLDGTIRLWRLGARLESIGQVRVPPGWGARVVTLSRDGRVLAAGNFTGEVRWWRRDRLDEPASRPVLSSARVDTIALSPDGRAVTAGGPANGVKVWRTEDGAEIGSLSTEGYVNDLAFSPDGRWLAAGELFGEVRVWNARDLGAPPRVLKADAGSVEAVSFDPSSRTLATGGEDTAIRLWHLQANPRTFAVLSRHTRTINSLAFSDDGRLLASAGDDSVVHAAPPPDVLAREVCTRVGRNLSRREWDTFIGPALRFGRICRNLPPPVEQYSGDSDLIGG